jgi:2,4-dienoyl-CoA reductase [(3E)-enoyl-CoA-producing], peroxisomal
VPVSFYFYYPLCPSPFAYTDLGGHAYLARGYGEHLIPTGRMGDVRDIANATVFLFSEAASWVTGQVLVVDGGSEHLRESLVPYPDAMLDPETTKKKIGAKL